MTADVLVYKFAEREKLKNTPEQKLRSSVSRVHNKRDGDQPCRRKSKALVTNDGENVYQQILNPALDVTPWSWGKTGIDEFIHDEYELHYEERKVAKLKLQIRKLAGRKSRVQTIRPAGISESSPKKVSAREEKGGANSPVLSTMITSS